RRPFPGASRPRHDHGKAGRVPARGGSGPGARAGRLARGPHGRGRAPRLLHGGGALGRARPRPRRRPPRPRGTPRTAGPRHPLSTPLLSVVIPAYNEGRRLPPTLEKIQRYLAGRPHEIVVVDDGSQDDTAARAAAAGVTVVKSEGNRGKGHAVRHGMLRARGQRRLMTDADLSTPIEELDRLMKKMDEGY